MDKDNDLVHVAGCPCIIHHVLCSACINCTEQSGFSQLFLHCAGIGAESPGGLTRSILDPRNTSTPYSYSHPSSSSGIYQSRPPSISYTQSPSTVPHPHPNPHTLYQSTSSQPSSRESNLITVANANSSAPSPVPPSSFQNGDPLSSLQRGTGRESRNQDQRYVWAVIMVTFPINLNILKEVHKVWITTG